MTTYRQLHVTLCLLLVTDAALLVSSDQWFNGMAHVLVKPRDSSMTGGLLSEIEDCLQRLIYMNITNSVILSSVNTRDNYLLSFGGTIQDVNDIPICLQNDTYQSEFGDNVTYEIHSISLQTYNNASMLGKQCKDRNMSVAYIEYIEANCVTFMDSSCADNITNSAYRYDIYQGGTTLHTFYCINADDMSDETCPMTTDGNWFYLRWDPTCSLFVIDITRPQLTSLTDSRLAEVTSIQINNLTPSWSCSDNFQYDYEIVLIIVPVVIHEGDLTFDSLPTWLVTCLKVLNGLSLAAALFCFVTYAIFSELRNAHGKNVLSLLTAVMISGVLSAGYIPLESANPQLCVFLAGLLYYFVLVPNFWWMSVAIFLAWTFGRRGIHLMDRSSGHRIFLLLSLLGWCLPLIFTLISLFLHIGGLDVFSEYCWVRPGWPTYLMALETFIPLLVDCVLFVLVVSRLRTARRELESFNKEKPRPASQNGKAHTTARTTDHALTIKVNVI